MSFSVMPRVGLADRPIVSGEPIRSCGIGEVIFLLASIPVEVGAARTLPNLITFSFLKRELYLGIFSYLRLKF